MSQFNFVPPCILYSIWKLTLRIASLSLSGGNLRFITKVKFLVVSRSWSLATYSVYFCPSSVRAASRFQLSFCSNCKYTGLHKIKVLQVIRMLYTLTLCSLKTSMYGHELCDVTSRNICEATCSQFSRASLASVPFLVQSLLLLTVSTPCAWI